MEAANTMKVSDAMRIGATKRPQVFYAYMLEQDDGEIAGCAELSAIEGATGFLPSEYADFEELFYETFPPVGGVRLDCPIPLKDVCGKGYRMSDLILHLSDRHKLSREAIADHIASLGY